MEIKQGASVRVRRRIGQIRAKGISAKAVGIVVAVGISLLGVGAFQIDAITTMLSSGDTIRVEFSRDYKLEDNRSEVRIADSRVGTVSGVEPTDHGTVVVSMKVDEDALDSVGSTPSAAVHPTTLLGGVYYVSLVPGGGHGEFDGGTIPLQRTSVPVELDRVLSAVTPPARQGAQTAVRQLDGTLRQGGRGAARSLLTNAPDTLNPLGGVLEGARGTQPGSDLTDLVQGLQTTTAELNRADGRLDSIFANLHRTTAALNAGSQPLADSIKTMPNTLRTTRTGLGDLSGSLDRLTSTAGPLRPAARSLDTTLATLDPVLVRTRPVMSDTRALMTDARPLVQQLVPTADAATQNLENVRGPVLDRVNGPIKQMVLSPWKGTGPYENGGNDHRFYEEVGYLGVQGSKVWQTHDHNGAQGRLMAGVSGRTVGGSAVPMSLEQYLESLGLEQPPGPQEDAHSGGGLPQIPTPPKEHP